MSTEISLTARRSTIRSPRNADTLDYHLLNWSAWHRTGGVGLGLDVSDGVHGCLTFQDMCRRMDRRNAVIFEALVNDLPPAHHAALHHQYLGTLWRFPRVNLRVVLTQARELLRVGMHERGLV